MSWTRTPRLACEGEEEQARPSVVAQWVSRVSTWASVAEAQFLARSNEILGNGARFPSRDLCVRISAPTEDLANPSRAKKRRRNFIFIFMVFFFSPLSLSLSSLSFPSIRELSLALAIHLFSWPSSPSPPLPQHRQPCFSGIASWREVDKKKVCQLLIRELHPCRACLCGRGALS